MIITHRLLVSGREVIALDNLPAAKRYGADRFRRLGHAGADTKWEDLPDGSSLLTWRHPREKDYRTSNYRIEEVGAS